MSLVRVACAACGSRKLDLNGPEPMCGECRIVPRGHRVLARLPLRVRAAVHELDCIECRVTWHSWLQRLVGDRRGHSPKPRP